MNDGSEQVPSKGGARRLSGVKLVLIVVAVAVVSSVVTVWMATQYLFRREFQPVELSEREAEVLDAKLARLDPTAGQGTPVSRGWDERSARGQAETDGPLRPERYDESDASRRIRLSEREVNALLARNTNLARKLAIDLAQDQVSAKLLIPLDPDFPFLGGKTLRVTGGLGLRYDSGKPVVILKGVSLWGVPLPNAWLGGIKNVDLVKEFSAQNGFWHAFAAGVEDLQVKDGALELVLKE